MQAGRDYAVVWSDNGAPAQPGRLVVSERGLELHSKADDGQPATVFIPRSTLANVYAANGNDERLNCCPTIVLERRDGNKVKIGALEFAVVRELLDRVATLPDDTSTSRALVVVPLRKGTAAKARELIAEGPPFDPAAVGLTRHEVFVNDDHALFLLESPRIEETVDRMLRDLSVWRGAVAWRSCLDGRPVLASSVYSWASDGQNQ